MRNFQRIKETENITKIGFIIIGCLIFSMNYYNIKFFIFIDKL